eukprot:CAMPEP_0119358042 /NCGR_PEP_ID=MMETSP1334-20130426/6322_1 /TAXON_ID=127549 /ORGANISM="Calcidiscus leptoporus, Strain RCC1130" /LENGTH=88 /DNA_ID=CAMNT_0007372441 /DNA_START=176 /DNA_END=442 /DNA_ORIENTATION=+
MSCTLRASAVVHHSAAHPCSRNAIAMREVYYAKKFAVPLARWGAAAGSVVLFLGFDDIPAILLQTNYGVPCSWKDVGIAAGLLKGPED